jgi:hypothetical protein
MVTPELEKLILAGKASYKTFVAGGAAKSVLQMGTNRFVIITDFVYYPFIPYSQEAVDRITGAVTLRDIAGKNLTQLNIFSQKSFNHFVFKNNISPIVDDNTAIFAGDPIKIDTYLIHEKDVTFDFIREPPNTVPPIANVGLVQTDIGIGNNSVPSKGRPLDYGGEGIVSPLGLNLNVNLRNTWDDNTGTTIAQSRPLGNDSIPFTVPAVGNFNLLQLPVADETSITQGINNIAITYPVLNVGYVEILGKRGELIQTSS